MGARKRWRSSQYVEGSCIREMMALKEDWKGKEKRATIVDDHLLGRWCLKTKGKIRMMDLEV